jgi:hypothetical protein
MMQMQMAKEQATMQYIQAQIAEIQSRIEQNSVETQLLPVAEETKRLAALSSSARADETDKEFERRVKLAELVLKEREIASKEEIVERQMRTQP